jgi:hypothetical protein
MTTKDFNTEFTEKRGEHGENEQNQKLRFMEAIIWVWTACQE